MSSLNMHALRVAILNRDRETHPGGDLVQIDATIKALAERGVHSEYAPADWTSEWLRDFDLAHVFHINFGWSRQNFEGVWRARLPYVVTPIFYPTDELGASAIEMASWLSHASAVMPHSARETIEIQRITGFSVGRVPLIPNGTAREFHADLSDAAALKQRNGVLAVAARDGDKQTDKVRAACELARLPFTLATGVSRADMPAIYKQHRVFVNFSGSERMSLTTGEALCAGCRVIDTTENRGNIWYGGDLETISPSCSTLMLAGALRWAYEYPHWSYRPNARAQVLTWDLIAFDLKRLAYEPAVREHVIA